MSHRTDLEHGSERTDVDYIQSTRPGHRLDEGDPFAFEDNLSFALAKDSQAQSSRDGAGQHGVAEPKNGWLFRNAERLSHDPENQTVVGLTAIQANQGAVRLQQRSVSQVRGVGEKSFAKPEARLARFTSDLVCGEEGAEFKQRVNVVGRGGSMCLNYPNEISRGQGMLQDTVQDIAEDASI